MTSNLISKHSTTASNPRPKRRLPIPSTQPFNHSCSNSLAPNDIATRMSLTLLRAPPQTTKNQHQPRTDNSVNRNYRSRLVPRMTKQCLHLCLIQDPQILTQDLPSYNLPPRSRPFLDQRPTQNLPTTLLQLEESSIRNPTITFAFPASTPTASDSLLSQPLYNFLLISTLTSNAFPKSISARNNVQCAGNCFTKCALPTLKRNRHGARVRFQPSTPSNPAALG